MPPAIRVENLSKRYRIGKKRAGRNLSEVLHDGVRSAWSKVRRLGDADHAEAGTEDFWALKDVSFEVAEGEVVGIIGRNGAGKSTLLKILSRIVEPTSGGAEIHGRLGSLLEVGTGFNPELTGRENIYLNGSILGMKKREIEAKFDEIVAFSEVEQFLDTPVKRYSSGMYVRLAFSVAAHLEPDVLIVDEVLAVGDQSFQNKCLGKIGDLSREGRTVFFVSHNVTSVLALCNRSILLKTGSLAFYGSPSDALANYLSLGNELDADWSRGSNTKLQSKQMAWFDRLTIKNEYGITCSQLPANRPFVIDIHYTISEKCSCQLAFRINRNDGQTVLTTADGDARHSVFTDRIPGVYKVKVHMPGPLLPPGQYHILAAINSPSRLTYDFLDRILLFEIDQAGSMWELDNRLGFVLPTLLWE